MKTMKSIVLITLCSVIICSCSQKSATPPHLVAVPKNAAVVLSLNAKQIVEKAGLNDLEQYKFYSVLKKEIESRSAEETKIVKDFLKDTRTSGLNLDQMFVYLLSDDPTKDTEDIGYGMTFLIDDVKTFENALKKIDVDADKIESRLIKLDRRTTIQWNDEILVLSKNGAGNGIDLFNEEKEKSILANEIFKSEYSGKDDAYLYFEYNFIRHILALIPNYYGHAGYISGYQEEILSSAFEMYDGIAASVSFNAEKGEFVATGKMLPEDKATALFEKIYKKDFDSDLYKYFPDKSLLAFKTAIKPLSVYNEYYKKYLDISNEVIQNELKKYGAKVVDKVKAQLKQSDKKITSVLGCFTGDIIGSLAGISDLSMPDLAEEAGVAGEKENDLIALVEEAGFVKNTKGYHSLNLYNHYKIYFAINNRIAYLTGSTANIEKFLDNSYYSSDITAAKDFGKELKSAMSYFYWDININDYPALLKGLVEMSSNGRRAMPLFDLLKSINVRATGLNSTEFKIKLNGNEYASKTLLKGIDELASVHLGY